MVGAPEVGEMITNAGISGLQYDGEAAFNAVVYHQKQLNDVSWGESMAEGLAFGLVGKGIGALKLGSKIGSGVSKLRMGTSELAYKAAGYAAEKEAPVMAKGLTKVGNLVAKGAKLGSKSEFPEESTIASKVLDHAMGYAKYIGKSIAIGTFFGDLVQVAENVHEHKDPWQGLGEATADHVIGGLIGGGTSFIYFLLQGVT